MPATKNTLSIAQSSSTDALFRAIVAGVINQLLAAGIVQTADTGQIDPLTVTAPTVTQAPKGYAMFRFADALQATFPVFFKIEFGAGTNVATPRIWLTVGTATDGAGNLTGIIGERVDATPNSNELTVSNCFFCCDTGRVSIALWCKTSSPTTVYIIIDRIKDPVTGADTAGGVFYFIGAQVSSLEGYGQVVAPAEFGGAIAKDRLIGSLPNSVASGADVSIMGIHPIRGKLLNPILGGVGYPKGAIAQNIPFTVSMYGVNHTFIACGSNSSGGAYFTQSGLTSTPSNAIAIRWEN